MVQFDQKDIEDLEDLDNSLLRQILNVPFTVPKEVLFLELVILDIGTIIKARRINYLHTLLKCSESEMLFKFFKTQWDHSASGDWTRQVKVYLTDFGISQDLEEIKLKSTYSFKKLVQVKSKEYALYKYLGKKEKHSKLENLFYPELKMQDYLKSQNLSVEQAKTVFLYRSSMAQYSANYPNGSEVSPCPLCHLHIDNQPMGFKNCLVIKDNIEVKGKYENIFSDQIKPQLAQSLIEIEKYAENFLKNRTVK